MSNDTIRVVVAYHSGYGHTGKQAQAVARGAASVEGTEAELRDVAELNDQLWEALDRAHAIIFGAPTYMGSPSAVFKAFAEGTSKAWGDNLRWKDKIAAGFTNSQNINGDKLNSLVDFAILAAQHGMHWVSLGLYPGWNTSTASAEDLNRLGSFLGAMAQSNGDEDPDMAPPATDLATAEELGRRVATVTHQWVRGRGSPGTGETPADLQEAYAGATNLATPMVRMANSSAATTAGPTAETGPQETDNRRAGGRQGEEHEDHEEQHSVHRTPRTAGPAPDLRAGV